MRFTRICKRMSNFIFQSSLPHVEIQVKDGTQTITFSQGAPRATVSCGEPFSAPGIHSFQVHMRNKPVKTAVGFLSENEATEYMREEPIGEKFISMGGAGWVHPKEIAANHKYGQGDRVRVEVNFDQSKVLFYVNDEFAGEDEWLIQRAYPAISVDGGPCDLDVTF